MRTILGYFGDNVKSFPTYQTLSCKSFPTYQTLSCKSFPTYQTLSCKSFFYEKKSYFRFNGTEKFKVVYEEEKTVLEKSFYEL